MRIAGIWLVSSRELKPCKDVYLSSALAQRYVRSPSYERTMARKPHPGHTFVQSFNNKPLATFLLELVEALAIYD